MLLLYASQVSMARTYGTRLYASMLNAKLSSHPKYSSSKGNREDRPLDDAAAARSGAALEAATADPDATRIIIASPSS